MKLKERRNFRETRERRSLGGDHSDNWAISYGDMITLLLAFFVLFFNVGVKTSQIHFLEEDLKKNFTFIEEKKEVDRSPDSVSLWGSTNEGIEDFPEIYTRKLKKLPKLTAVIEGNRMLVEFPGVSFFDSAQYKLTSRGEKVLQDFATTFKKYTGDMRLIVRGYTDNTPVKSGHDYQDNLELSSKRSVSAIRILNQAGIPFEMMRIGGYGETDKNKILTEKEKRKYDRKIVLVVEPLDSTERGFSKEVL